MAPRLLSIPAAALDVDRRTVYRFIAAGELPVVDLRTGPARSRVRVLAASLDDFINSRAVAHLRAAADQDRVPPYAKQEGTEPRTSGS
ncbi:helix-turn-helix domain-containing protein [Streptomyces sp. NPDC059851]|uniref:helix-turn-helix domain-containing protein n=1 Tax=Streptomyces sp. NPDC059851 TaxID=3346971 RepID=UPI003655CBA2